MSAATSGMQCDTMCWSELTSGGGSGVGDGLGVTVGDGVGGGAGDVLTTRRVDVIRQDIADYQNITKTSPQDN